MCVHTWLPPLLLICTHINPEAMCTPLTVHNHTHLAGKHPSSLRRPRPKNRYLPRQSLAPYMARCQSPLNRNATRCISSMFIAYFALCKKDSAAFFVHLTLDISRAASNVHEIKHDKCNMYDSRQEIWIDWIHHVVHIWFASQVRAIFSLFLCSESFNAIIPCLSAGFYGWW